MFEGREEIINNVLEFSTNLLDKTSGTTAKTSAVRIVFAVVKKSNLIRKIIPAKVNIFKDTHKIDRKMGNNTWNFVDC